MARRRPSRPGHRFSGTNAEPDVSRRNAGTQRAILAAAARLVRRHGYNRVTIEAIAAEAGAGKQTIYRWWKTKPALFADLLGTTEPQSPGRGGLAVRVAKVLRELARATATPLQAQIQAGLLAEAAREPAIIERLVGGQAERLRAVLAQARKAGELRRTADMKMAADRLVAALWFQTVIRRRRADGRFIAGLVAQTLRGLAA